MRRRNAAATDPEERAFSREVAVVAIIVGLGVVGGAIWTLIGRENVPNPSEYSADRAAAEAGTAPSAPPENAVAPPRRPNSP